MKVTCSNCGAQFNIDESKIPSQGARLRCAKCHERFVVHPPAQAQDQVYAPPVPDSAAVPVPPPAAPAPSATGLDAPVALPDAGPAPVAAQVQNIGAIALPDAGPAPVAAPVENIGAIALPDAGPAPVAAPVENIGAIALPDGSADAFGGLDETGMPLSPGRVTEDTSPIPAPLTSDDLFGASGIANSPVPPMDSIDFGTSGNADGAPIALGDGSDDSPALAGSMMSPQEMADMSSHSFDLGGGDGAPIALGDGSDVPPAPAQGGAVALPGDGIEYDFSEGGVALPGTGLEDSGVALPGDVAGDFSAMPPPIPGEEAPSIALPGISVDDSGVALPGIGLEDTGVALPGTGLEDSGVALPGISADDSGVALPGIGLEDTGVALPGTGMEDSGAALPGNDVASGFLDDGGPVALPSGDSGSDLAASLFDAPPPVPQSAEDAVPSGDLASSLFDENAGDLSSDMGPVRLPDAPIAGEMSPPPVPTSAVSSALPEAPFGSGFEAPSPVPGEDVASAFLKSLESSVADELAEGAAANAAAQAAAMAEEDGELGGEGPLDEELPASGDSGISIQDLFGGPDADLGAPSVASAARMSSSTGSGAAAVAAAMMDLDPAVPSGDLTGDGDSLDPAIEGQGDSERPLDIASVFGDSSSSGAQAGDAGTEGGDGGDISNLLTFSNDASDASSAPAANGDDAPLELDLGNDADAGRRNASKAPADGKDDVEVLDFIEEGGKNQPTFIGDGTTYYVRRGEEKPRGPFDMVTTIYMVNSGQLLGDEEISTDQEHWAPLTSVPAFAAAIKQLMESPGDLKFAVENMANAVPSPKNEALQRAKARYGDRIAELKVVTSVDPKEKFLTKQVIAAGISVLLIAGIGGGLGFTPVGPFGVNWLFPKEIKKGTAEETQYLQAKAELRKGTWAGAKEALRISERLIGKDMSLIEPRALYAQSVFYLKRVYGTNGSQMQQAEKYLREITSDNEKKGGNKSETLKALVAKDLFAKSAAHRNALDKYLEKHSDDVDARFLQAELLAALGDLDESQKSLKELADLPEMGARAYMALARQAMEQVVPEDQWVEMKAVESMDGIQAQDDGKKPAESEGSQTEEVKAGAAAADKDAPGAADEGSAGGEAAEAAPEAAEAPAVAKAEGKAKAAAPAEPAIDLSKVDGDADAQETASTKVQERTVKVSPAVLKAMDYLDRAIAADAQSVEAYLAKGEILTLKTVNRPEALKVLALLDGADRRELLSDDDQSKADFLIGQNLLALRQFEKAFAAFDKAMETGPDNGEIPALYGSVKMNQGDYDKAEKLFAKARETNRDNETYLDGQVRALIALEKHHPAQSMLKEAAEEHPESTRIALLQGLVHDALKEVDDALPFYAKAVTDEKVGWEASVQLGNIWLNRNKLDDAKAAFDKALEQGGERSQPHVGLGRYHLAMNNPEEALASFDTAIRLDGDDAKAHLGRGEALAALSRLPEAERAFARATAINEKLPTLMARYGELLWRMEKRERAVAAFGKAKDQDYKDVGSMWRKGAVEFQMGRYEEALSDLSNALASWPGLEEALYYKARTNYARNEASQALQAIKGALERNRSKPEYHFWAGNIYALAQKMADAVAEWQETIKLDGGHADAMEALGHAFQDQANFGQAAAYFEETLAHAPGRTALYRNIADCRFSMNRFNDAIKNYQKVLDINPRDTDANFRIGMAYNSMHQMDQAVLWYEKTLALDDGFAEAWKALGFAYKEKFQYAKAIHAFERFMKVSDNARDKRMVETEIFDLKQLL